MFYVLEQSDHPFQAKAVAGENLNFALIWRYPVASHWKAGLARNIIFSNTLRRYAWLISLFFMLARYQITNILVSFIVRSTQYLYEIKIACDSLTPLIYPC